MSDVCLILEGTYPYVTGGVSSCVHQLIQETPELEYQIVFIGASRKSYKEYKYEIPKNVRSISEVYLYENLYIDPGTPKPLGLTAKEVDCLRNSILFNTVGDIESFYKTFFIDRLDNLEPLDLFFCKESWDILVEIYNESYNQNDLNSFVDFFYNWRFSSLPIITVLSAQLPSAEIYHSLCTGYAGLLGCLAKLTSRGRFVLTEHGIYSHERKIEISLSQWIYTDTTIVVPHKNLSFLKQWWLDKFYQLGSLSYEYADIITTLYQGNKDRQIELGAEEDKIEIIANGISETKLKTGVKKNKIYKSQKKYCIGLVGRVVPVKDIKTFIKAVKKVSVVIEDIEVLIMGPTDEDLEYFEDCKVLIQILGLEQIIRFTDKVDLKYYYQSLDLIVLSSISEGQPLVILEAFAFKVPAIATDVGSCRELIEGVGDDKINGEAGIVVPFGDTSLLADAIILLLTDDEMRTAFGENAYKRFSGFYRETQSIDKYKTVYQQFIVEDL